MATRLSEMFFAGFFSGAPMVALAWLVVAGRAR